MNRLIILFTIFTLFLNADLSVEAIKKMVNKIHQKREGVKLETLVNTKEPFVRLEQENNVSTFVIPTIEKKEEAKLILHAIMNEKAYINDSWVAISDSILGYDLKFIGKRGVVLRNENHIKKLFLRKKRDSFIKLKERY